MFNGFLHLQTIAPMVIMSVAVRKLTSNLQNIYSPVGCQ
jgi:hypothetical protein